MQTFTETFGPRGEFEASLEISEGLTQGWVNGPDGYSATLDALIAEGCLTCRGHGVLIDQTVVDDIQDWAEENGY